MITTLRAHGARQTSGVRTRARAGSRGKVERHGIVPVSTRTLVFGHRIYASYRIAATAASTAAGSRCDSVHSFIHYVGRTQ